MSGKVLILKDGEVPDEIRQTGTEVDGKVAADVNVTNKEISNMYSAIGEPKSIPDSDTIMDRLKKIETAIIAQKPLVLKESFDESDLTDGIYTIGDYGTGYKGVSITNNNASESLTLTIGSIVVLIAKTKTFYAIFEDFDTLQITGTGKDFDGYIEA